MGGCTAFLRWQTTPRVAAADVEEFIKASMRVGSSKSDVEAWLHNRFEARSEYRNALGRTVIRCWIMDSGPRMDLIPLVVFPDDIRIEFVFDRDDKLLSYSAKRESRF
jgi:hypothetical protein